MSTGGTLSEKEQEKLRVIKNAVEGRTTNGEAGKLLCLSVRQIKRLKQHFRREGETAMVHGLKNKKSNHAFSNIVKEETLHIIEKNYADFKPGFATEKLQELHQMEMTSQTIRVWMTEKGLWKKRKQKKTGAYHAWRLPKEYYGELEQFDGSYHYWFEDRFVDAYGEPIEVCLLASIDDATGKITRAIFAANEGIHAVFVFWRGYVTEASKPLKIYLDKFSTYKINHKSAVDNHELITQFGRSMQDLEIELVFANSPQAKGRIERLFETLQDRLVKELRLAKINTPEAGNQFLTEVFIPAFNKRFGHAPRKEGDVHRPLSETDKKNLSRIFSIQSQRKINNDFTIQFKNNWYQLLEIQTTTVRAREIVLVEEWLDGTIHFSIRGYCLNSALSPGRPKRIKEQPSILTNHKLNWKPSEDHPWRKFKIKKS